MNIKTSELAKWGLDYCVAQIKKTLPMSFDDWEQTWPHYSSQWAHGGPIIEREHIEARIENYSAGVVTWRAHTTGNNNHTFWADSPLLLVATMRCYVASQLGDEVEVPDELCTNTP